MSSQAYSSAVTSPGEERSAPSEAGRSGAPRAIDYVVEIDGQGVGTSPYLDLGVPVFRFGPAGRSYTFTVSARTSQVMSPRSQPVTAYIASCAG